MRALEREAVKQELVEQMTKWAVAAAVASVALMGVFALVAALLIAFDIPQWVQIVGGTVLALGTAAFAWLVASALEAGRRNARQQGSREHIHPVPHD
jgi:protein-S-isoprenylcysteine O-methyltransferase Ste14